MKNVTKYEKKKCIIKVLDDFQRDIRTIYNNTVQVHCNYEGISFEKEGEDISTDDILASLSTYYGVKITSIHIDDCDLIGVWLCYKNPKPLLKHIKKEIKQALETYSEENVDVVVDELTGKLQIIYHSNNNSFPINDALCDKNDVDLSEVTKLCDKYKVGHCW